MHRIVFTKQASKTLLRMPRNVADRIREKLDLVAKNPHGHHHNVTKLQNRPGYRLRIGDWRVIYEIHKDELIIVVLKIASRGEAYR